MSEFDALLELKITLREGRLIKNASFHPNSGGNWLIKNDDAKVINYNPGREYRFMYANQPAIGIYAPTESVFTKHQALALAALIKKMAEHLPDGEGADVKGRRK